jgi:Zn-dependent peptidase ImmA (M78 family)
MNAVALDPKVEAEHTLTRFWPHLRLPIDSIAIAHGMGFEIQEMQASQNMLSLLMKRPDGAPVILLSSQAAPVQRRFACAREIGHFLWNAEERQYGTGARESTNVGPGSGEGFGHAFAVHLLIPEHWLRAAATKDIVAVAFQRGILH